MASIRLGNPTKYIKKLMEEEEANKMKLYCKDCTHCKTLYKRENNHYILAGQCICELHNQLINKCNIACIDIKEPIIFTDQDRRELDRLTLKLAQATNINY